MQRNIYIVWPCVWLSIRLLYLESSTQMLRFSSLCIWNFRIKIFADQMAFELFTDKTSVLHRYKMYKIGVSIGAFTQMMFFFLSFFFFPFLSKHPERETFKKWRICEKIRKANGRGKKIFGYISLPDGYSKIKHGYKFE